MTHWRLENGDWKFSVGFTLVELLVVISIFGILASIGLVSFESSQARSRDAQRKSDLKEIGSALELFYSDYGQYHPSSNGQIEACPFDSVKRTGSLCTWGVSEFRDVDGSGNTKTTYFKVLPKDSSNGHTYFYKGVTVDSISNAGYQIFARLENSQDQSIISTGISCGSIICNFASTSSNTTPSAQ